MFIVVCHPPTFVVVPPSFFSFQGIRVVNKTDPILPRELIQMTTKNGNSFTKIFLVDMFGVHLLPCPPVQFDQLRFSSETRSFIQITTNDFKSLGKVLWIVWVLSFHYI
eukprot:TRINITY_DN9082_c0_g1_i2.p3 TRINITY_DN9082_c0_g1~~TRINITY_DN9082_c0_g1_i2.p3  ORF type:complete len:109 (+),score=10.74 TRINITY_DN9082_c0_g1_i2:452-778(+)